MYNYIELLKHILKHGNTHTDRTGVGTLRVFGKSLEFDLQEGFPVLALRKTPWKSAIGEMIGFIRGYNTVEQFELLGCKFWKANAEGWKSTYADGDYLGRIYGIQARDWNGEYDQLANVFDEIKTNPDSRRLLVTHWRPDEFKYMALPPCHVQYQFFVDKNTKEMSLKFDMRSTDMVLGAPNNIVGYAFLLWVTAHAFGYTPRKLYMTMGDCHIYQDHIDGVNEMIRRDGYDFFSKFPVLMINPTNPPIKLNSFTSELAWVEHLTPDNFMLHNYKPLGKIDFKMAV